MICDVSAKTIIAQKNVDGLAVGTFLAFSPNGEQLVVGGAPPRRGDAVNNAGFLTQTVRLDAPTGDRLSVMPLPADTRLLNVSPDGTRLAAVKLVEAPTQGPGVTRPGSELTIRNAAGQVVHAIAVPEGVKDVCFSADGKRLAGIGVLTSTIHVWRVETGTEEFTVRGQSVPIRQITFRPDGDQLIALDTAGTVKTWGPAGPPDRVRMPIVAIRNTPRNVSSDGRRTLIAQWTSTELPSPATTLEVSIHDESGRVFPTWKRTWATHQDRVLPNQKSWP